MPRASSSLSPLFLLGTPYASMAVVPAAPSLRVASSPAGLPAGCALRPYDPARARDVAALADICADVYGGTDYLPATAASYAADPACSFLALTTTTDAEGAGGDADRGILAVANYKRLPAQRAAWIEAVRTHPAHRGQGWATTLLRALVDLARRDSDGAEDARADAPPPAPTEVLTCTVRSNRKMLRVLERVGFRERGTLVSSCWSTLRRLPGWSPDSDAVPRPLLDALDLRHTVSAAARAVAPSSWRTISTDADLIERLRTLQAEGGCAGYLPGCYEYIVPGPGRRDLRRSMDHGLVLTLEADVDGTAERAVLAFTRDARISSLKSPWVCSVAAHAPVAFEAALWHAHSPEVARRLRSCPHEDGDGDDGAAARREDAEEEDAAVPFLLVFDDAVPRDAGSLARALPRTADECVVLSYDHERSDS